MSFMSTDACFFLFSVAEPAPAAPAAVAPSATAPALPADNAIDPEFLKSLKVGIFTFI
jgi:hypothetical protein